MRVAVLHGHDQRAWSRAYADGEAPARLPYGVDALAEAGIDLDVHGRRDLRLLAKPRDVVEHRTGVRVQSALAAAPAASRADLVLALLEGEGALPALWRRRGLPPYAGRPLVVWSCWLADDVARADRETRERLRRRFAGADLITHLSRHETEILVDLGIPEERLFAVTYGVSADYYRPGETERDVTVLAVGQDRGRDYATLFEAVRGTGIAVEVVCRPENLAGLDVPDEVTVRPPVPHRTYRDLLRRTRIMVVPTRVMAYPTGSSVALEAAASGCCVLATDTPAMADYLAHDETGVLLPVGDAGAWRRALGDLVADPERTARIGAAARRSVETRFNARHMWRELAEVLSDRGLLPSGAAG